MSAGRGAGPSLAGLLGEAVDVLAGSGHALLGGAVREAADCNRQLAAQVEELTISLAGAVRVGEAYAGMYRLAAQNADHYRGVLRRIAGAADAGRAREIARGALS